MSCNAMVRDINGSSLRCEKREGHKGTHVVWVNRAIEWDDSTRKETAELDFLAQRWPIKEPWWRSKRR